MTDGRDGPRSSRHIAISVSTCRYGHAPFKWTIRQVTLGHSHTPCFKIAYHPSPIASPMPKVVSEIGAEDSVQQIVKLLVLRALEFGDVNPNLSSDFRRQFQRRFAAFERSQSCTVRFPLAVHLCPSALLLILVTRAYACNASAAMNVTSSVLTREKRYQRRARKDLNKTPLLLLPNYHRPLHEPCGHKLSHQSSNAPTLLECGPTGDWNRSREKCWTAPRSCGSCLQNDSVKQLRSFKTLIEFKN